MLGIRSSRNMAEQAQYTNGDINGNINGEVPSFYTRHSRPDPDYSPLGTATMNGADGHSPDDTANLMAERHSISSEVTADSGLPTDRHSTSSSPTFDQRPGELQTVTITQHRGLGLCIIGGTNRVEGPLIYIDDLIEGADAHKVCSMWMFFFGTSVFFLLICNIAHIDLFAMDIPFYLLSK